MSDKIVEIFTRILPSVPSGAADTFAHGMRTYICAFKAQRDNDMNYESTPDYQNGWNEIMVVQADDLWVHTPHFNNILGLSISELFRTKITMFSPPCTVEIFRTVVFVDAHFNRWIISIMQSEIDPEQIRVCARFPRSGTKVEYFCLKKTENELSSPTFNTSCFKLLVYDANVWHDT